MSSFEASFGSFSATIHGVVVSSILIPAALSSLITGNVADLYGRPRTIMFGAAVFGIGAAIEAASNNLGAFIAGRVITGIGEGFFLSVLVVYVCEISPAKRRGPLASLPQFGTTIGIAAGYFIAYGTSTIDSSASWRVPLAFQSFMALSFAVSCTLVPPSPRWLLAKGRAKEAAQTLARLGIPSSELDESFQVSTEPEADAQDAQPTLRENIRATFRDLMKAFAPGVRKRTFLGCFIMGMQQLAGIDGVLYYAPLLFTQAGLSSEQASFLASGVSALVIFATTIPAMSFADHLGRRPSTIYGGLGLAGTMFLIGSLYASNSVHGDHGAGRWVVIVTIYLFAIIFSGSWAIAFKVYASEIQPIETRASASSLAQSTNWVSHRPAPGGDMFILTPCSSRTSSLHSRRLSSWRTRRTGCTSSSARARSSRWWCAQSRCRKRAAALWRPSTRPSTTTPGSAPRAGPLPRRHQRRLSAARRTRW